MRYKVNENCIGCGLCQRTCPEVFELTQEGTARVKADPVEESTARTAREAAENCPVSAIESEP